VEALFNLVAFAMCSLGCGWSYSPRITLFLCSVDLCAPVSGHPVLIWRLWQCFGVFEIVLCVSRFVVLSELSDRVFCVIRCACVQM